MGSVHSQKICEKGNVQKAAGDAYCAKLKAPGNEKDLKKWGKKFKCV